MKRKGNLVQCPKCKRWFAAEGLQSHYKSKHGKADKKLIKRVMATPTHRS